jgi:hypothetical protein
MSGNFYDSLGLKYKVGQKVFVRMYDKDDRSFLVSATIEKISGFERDRSNKNYGIYDISISDKYSGERGFDKSQSLWGHTITVPEGRIKSQIVIVGSGRKI